MTKTTRLFAIAGITALLAGCGGPSDFTPTQGMSAAEIYSNACEVCHGNNGAGKFGFLFKIAGTDSSAEEIATTIQQGGKIMPSFPNLNEEQRMMMAGYIKSL